MVQQTLHVAMLEDDSDDRLLTKEILSDLSIDLKLDFFSDSETLFRFLEKEMPNLVLVDFNSTPENGLQVLKRVKSHESFQHIPVIILSESHLSQYRNRCYAEGASSFITKPTSMEETKKKITSFFTYWSAVAES